MNLRGKRSRLIKMGLSEIQKSIEWPLVNDQNVWMCDKMKLIVYIKFIRTM